MQVLFKPPRMRDTLHPMNRAQLVDDVEAAAFVDLWAAAPPELALRLGLEVHRQAGATLLVAAGLPSPLFNRVIGLGMHQPATDADVDTIAAVYRDAGVASWWLHWNPAAGPADMPARLEARGFKLPPRCSWAKVWRGPEPAPAIMTSLRVAVARDAEVGATMQAVHRAFEMPPFMAAWLSAVHGRPGWRVYTAADGDAIVGGGCLYLDGDRAWLGMGSVLDTHRRRGGQGALMALRIADAVAAGCRHIVTETGEPIAGEPNPSLANMRRCGFETVCSRLNYAAQ